MCTNDNSSGIVAPGIKLKMTMDPDDRASILISISGRRYIRRKVGTTLQATCTQNTELDPEHYH